MRSIWDIWRGENCTPELDLEGIDHASQVFSREKEKLWLV